MGSCLCFCPEMIQWWDHSKIFIRTLGHCKKDDASNMSLNVAAGRCSCLLQYKRTQQQQMSPVFVVSLISSLNSKILNILESWSQSRCWSVVPHKTFTLSSIAVRSKHSNPSGVPSDIEIKILPWTSPAGCLQEHPAGGSWDFKHGWIGCSQAVGHGLS